MAREIGIIIIKILLLLAVIFIAIGFVKPDYNGTVSVTVNAPASKTFAVFNDTENLSKWMPGFKSIVKESGEKNQVGSKWKMHFNENGSDMVIYETVTAFEQDRHLAFDMKDRIANYHIDIRFDEINGQTIITQTSEGAGRGVVARSMMVISNGKIEKRNLDMYNKLKALVENP